MKILDVCCGSRMFWFDRENHRTIFLDNRHEYHSLKDKSSKGGFRDLIIKPDIQADFKTLPFKDNSFLMVVFDPPHYINAGEKGWLAKKYGVLKKSWQEDLRKGFSECFRVLQKNGTLVFKWSEYQIPTSKVLALIPEKPLFGNVRSKLAKSHWLVFMKHNKHINADTRIEPLVSVM